ncbi:MAG: site-specific integrase [Candidatus Rokuibacteriota bacterium]
MIGTITKRAVDALAPAAANTFLWDRELPRFGVKCTPASAKVYIVQYRTGRRLRRYTIGRHGAPWTPDLARKEALRLLALVASGIDPAAAKLAGRTAPSVRELAARVRTEHLVKRRAATRIEYERLLRLHILPALGSLAVADVGRPDVAKLHHALRKTPAQANRVVAVLSKIMNLAERWGLRADSSNPCRHVERNREQRRARFLSTEELGRLGQVLAQAARGPLTLPARRKKAPAVTVTVSPYALAAIALLIFTGARRGEILGLRWADVNLERGVLHLVTSKTGAPVVYLNAGARAILDRLPRVARNPYVIVGGRAGAHLVNLKDPWQVIRRAAQLEGVRLHDLRHTHASVGAAAGLGLPLIGALLGHTQAATTQRYAHLAADPVRAAAELVGARIAKALEA